MRAQDRPRAACTGRCRPLWPALSARQGPSSPASTSLVSLAVRCARPWQRWVILAGRRSTIRSPRLRPWRSRVHRSQQVRGRNDEDIEDINLLSAKDLMCIYRY